MTSVCIVASLLDNTFKALAMGLIIVSKVFIHIFRRVFVIFKSNSSNARYVSFWRHLLDDLNQVDSHLRDEFFYAALSLMSCNSSTNSLIVIVISFMSFLMSFNWSIFGSNLASTIIYILSNLCSASKCQLKWATPMRFHERNRKKKIIVENSS